MWSNQMAPEYTDLTLSNGGCLEQYFSIMLLHLERLVVRNDRYVDWGPTYGTWIHMVAFDIFVPVSLVQWLIVVTTWQDTLRIITMYNLLFLSGPFVIDILSWTSFDEWTLNFICDKTTIVETMNKVDKSPILFE